MKVQILTHSRAALAMVCGIAFVAGLPTFRAKADTWDKKTILTVNQTIQVRDTVLDPGQYVLRLYDSSSDRHIVQIFNADQSHLINTILAIPKQRMEPAGDSQFTFWETPPGTAKALRAWFYPGDTIGQEFPYPTHLKQLAMAEPAPTLLPAPDTTMTQPAPETTVQPEAMTDEPQDGEEAEAAEMSPPPAPVEAPAEAPAPAVTPEPSPAAQLPEELPKTASPYPMIGLAGAFLLGLAGLLRLKRSV